MKIRPAGIELFHANGETDVAKPITANASRTSQLMLYSEIIAVCSEIHTKHINTLCGQNVECRTYRALNTLRLGYKNQSVNAVKGNNRCLL
jgi:hypothetical protein